MVHNREAEQRSAIRNIKMTLNTSENATGASCRGRQSAPSRRIHIGRMLHSMDATSGGTPGHLFFESHVGRIVEPIFRATKKAGDTNIGREARDLAQTIVDLVLELQSGNVDITNIPSLHAEMLDDHSLLVEWLFPNYRIGFSICSDARDSSWYMVSTSASTASNQSGALGTDKKTLLTGLVSFVVMNS